VLPYIVAATFFMEYLDTTIIATALPQMARSFAIGPNEVSLGMTAYMLTLAVFIPLSGWIADRFGSRAVFGVAIVIFTLASVSCGLSTGLVSFTLSRVLQGIGGALMVPVGRMIVVRNTEKGRLMQAISTITWPAIVAPVLGPTVGGFITTYASWHWVFLLNAPFGVAALVATLAFVPDQRAEARRPLDLVGFFIGGAALTLLLYGTELASRRDASLGAIAGFLVAGLVAGLIAIRHAQTTPHPLLDFETLRVPTFAVTVVSGSATRIGMEAVPYLLPLLFQIGFGLSAFRSGLMMLIAAIANLGMKMFTTKIMSRYGFRSVPVVTCATGAVAVLACGWLSPATPMAVVAVVLVTCGLTRSLQFSTLATLAYADISDAQKGAASTLWSVAQQMTIGMGIAFGALSLRLAGLIDAGGVESAPIALADFRWAFAAAAALILASVPGYARLPSDAGIGIGVAARRAAVPASSR
jgi:EmrB/QacA subfamily drug resistance transporter